MTLPTTIPSALALLKGARAPEIVFGTDPTQVSALYRAFAKVVHEDMAPKTLLPQAHEAFLLLTKLHEAALEKVKRGTYGDGKPLVTAVLSTKTASYELASVIRSDDISDYYEATNTKDNSSVVVRVVNDPANSDLLKAEADILAILPTTFTDTKHSIYFPNLRDSFEIGVGKTRRRANVFLPMGQDMIPLTEIRKGYPKGIDPRDAAWMWNRQMEAIHLLHLQGYIHGAVTPDSFFIDPANHTGTLTDLAYAVKADQKGKVILPRWASTYPQEVALKTPLDYSTDVYMSAQCMNYLVGGSAAVVKNSPPELGALLRSCFLGKAHRVKLMETLYSEFKTLSKRLWGPKTFRIFPWPPETT